MPSTDGPRCAGSSMMAVLVAATRVDGKFQIA